MTGTPSDGPATVTTEAPPAPFTADDYRARMRAPPGRRGRRARRAAGRARPRPGVAHRLPARRETERLTLLVLPPARTRCSWSRPWRPRTPPEAPGAPALTLRDWTDGKDPYAAAAPLLDAARPVRRQRQRLGDAPARPAAGAARDLVRLAHRGPADAAGGEGRGRAGAAGGGGRGRRRGVRGDPARCRFAGRRETDVAADLAALLRRFGHSQVDFTIVALGPERRQPAPRGRRPRHRARRHGRPRLRRPQGRLRLRHLPHGPRRRTDRRGARGPRPRAGGPGGGVPCGTAGRGLPGRRPGGPRGHRRRRVRRPASSTAPGTASASPPTSRRT